MSSRFTATLSFLCLLGLALTPLPVPAAELRGFGAVQASKLPGGGGMKFSCDSPAHAVQLIHKLAHDMAASATIPSHWVDVTLAGRTAPVLVRPGLGAYLVLAQGSDAYCFTVPLPAGQGESGLGESFAPAASLVPGAQFYDAAYVYPFYLDKWSDKGMGTWYTPYDSFDDDPKGMKDVVNPHFQYLSKNGLTVHVMDGTKAETLHFVHKYDRPYHFAHWLKWDDDIARLDPFDLTVPSNLFTGASDYYGDISNGGAKLQQFRNWDFQNVMAPAVTDPNLVDWDEPHGEMSVGSAQSSDDRGENNRSNFVHWLQTERKYTLTSLGQAWHHDPKFFAGWSPVPIPDEYSLLGADKNSVFADRTWRLHNADLLPGVAAGYTRSKFDDRRWFSLQLPGGEVGALMEYVYKPFWYRGTVSVTPAYLAAHKGPLYLIVASMTQAGGPKSPDHVWFNGVDTGALTGPGGWGITGTKDVTGLVHSGANHISYKPTRSYMPGTFFLSTKPMERYPHKDSGLNARTVDWSDYLVAMAVDQERETIQTIRATDPNRPIKSMAVGDKSAYTPMLADYGAFGHNTGDEAFFFPWDKRLGYPYGIRASAESSGSMVDPASFQRWFGWFIFSGLNAFDNFIDVEAMMYSKSTPYWQADFPYLHLANRYNLKKPEIGLIWSGFNGRFSPGENGANPYVFDLGRGDLQSLGYSYAYLDEPGLHRHLGDGYKVLWDEGTNVMSLQTVQDIKHYVEQGGTFVALQETGRHTPTQKDAWPIESLTGFHVKQIRPMGGFVSILPDQSVFTKLAGQNFENEGRSIDYSGYNFADKCLVLEAVAPGAQALARYRDGTIAIGMRKLGKGRVIVLGSPFWRDSYDKSGMWWPGDGQNAFLQDFLTGLGLPPDVPADTQKVWRDRYIANNGTEEYLLLFNPGDKDPQTFTTDWNASFLITQVYDPKTGQPVAAKIDGNTAHLALTLQPLETKILAVQSPRPPADTVSDWYADLAVVWKKSLPGHAATYPAGLPVYYADFTTTGGKIVETASVTPEHLAALTASADSEPGWNPDLNDVRPQYAELPTTSSQSVLYRWQIAVPSSWHPGDKYYLRLGDGARSVYLNGQRVGERDENGRDVSSLLRFSGSNYLIVAADWQGYNGRASLWRQPHAVSKLSLAGPWKVWVDEDHGTVTSQLPGSFNGMIATRKITVPAAWSKSHVFLRLKWDGQAAPRYLAVNDKVMFFDTDRPGYMDVTPWVKFGLPNTFLIQSQGMNNWLPAKVTIQSVQLEQVPHL
ncbi:MAG: hypothetical protein ACRYFS_11515 [Janthinobacterium lividum]